MAGKPDSNVENLFFQNVCSQFPNHSNLTSIISSMILPFKEKIKDILKKCLYEWTDKIRRNFSELTAQGLINEFEKRSSVKYLSKDKIK